MIDAKTPPEKGSYFLNDMNPYLKWTIKIYLFVCLFACFATPEIQNDQRQAS